MALPPPAGGRLAGQVSETSENGSGGAARRVAGDRLPVLAAPTVARPIEQAPGPGLPAPVLAATGGFVAGVAAWVLMRVLRRPRRALPRALRGRGKQRGALEVAATRSFLVDVHLLKR